MHEVGHAVILLVSPQMSNHEISFNTKLSDPIRTRADFTYKITPEVISIVDTGLGKCPVNEDIEAVLRKIEYWHQGSITSFKIMCLDGFLSVGQMLALQEFAIEHDCRLIVTRNT